MLSGLYREIEALGGATIMDDYDEGYTDGLNDALAVLRKFGFGLDMAPVTKEENSVSTNDDGGPAFPARCTTRRSVYAVCDEGGCPQLVPAVDVKDAPGMSLRDWFAAKAMPAVVATLEGNPISEEQVSAAIQMMAAMSYRIADAMLAARKVAA